MLAPESVLAGIIIGAIAVGWLGYWSRATVFD
jgi:hypothetical protein